MEPPKRSKLIAIDWGGQELPTLPSIAYRLMAMAGDDQASAGELASLIEQDPSLTVKLLKAVNSAFYALRMEVTSIKHGIVLLGMEEVRRIAIGSLLAERFMTIPKGVRPQAERLWRHLIATAIIAQDLSPTGDEDPDLYTLGLLHDMGWLVLLAQAPSIFKILVEEENASRADTERLWGSDHQLWGGRLAEQWELPEPFQVVAMGHHSPSDIVDPPKYLMLIHLANHLSTGAGFNLLKSPPEPLDPIVMEELELDEKTLLEMEKATWDDRQRIAQLCRIMAT